MRRLVVRLYNPHYEIKSEYCVGGSGGGVAVGSTKTLRLQQKAGYVR